jgi:hypothetical protein
LKESALALAWQGLVGVGALRLTATSRTPSGWNGSGQGRVVVQAPSAQVLVFAESGWWTSASGARFAFRNAYRWTLWPQTLCLEHLRQGADHPVFLLDLVPSSDARLRERAPHICGADRYHAALCLEGDLLYLTWTIKGPSKDEEVRCVYAPGEPFETS